MQRIWHALVPVALIGGLASGNLWGQERPRHERPGMMGHMHHERGHGHGMAAMLGPMARVMAYAPPHLLERRDALGLTAEQVTQLETLAQQVRQAHEKAEADVKTHREQLLAAWQSDRPDAEAIRRHAQAVTQAEQGAHLTAITAAAQAKGLLTPEQRGRVEGWVDAHQMMTRRRHER